jgi:hypothetical protein
VRRFTHSARMGRSRHAIELLTGRMRLPKTGAAISPPIMPPPPKSPASRLRRAAGRGRLASDSERVEHPDSRGEDGGDADTQGASWRLGGGAWRKGGAETIRVPVYSVTSWSGRL